MMMFLFVFLFVLPLTIVKPCFAFQIPAISTTTTTTTTTAFTTTTQTKKKRTTPFLFPHSSISSRKNAGFETQRWAVQEQQDETTTTSNTGTATGTTATTTTIDATTTTTTTSSSTDIEDVARKYRQEAEMMRLQAEQMELSLTLDKIQRLETKLESIQQIRRRRNEGDENNKNNKSDSNNNNDNAKESSSSQQKYLNQEAELQAQLQQLTEKLKQRDSNRNSKNKIKNNESSTTSATPPPSPPTTTTTTTTAKTALTNDPVTPTGDSSSTPIDTKKGGNNNLTLSSTTTTKTAATSTSISDKDTKTEKKRKLPETPLAGFDQVDLDLYIPVALEINAMLAANESNNTNANANANANTNTNTNTSLTSSVSMEEKLELFRTAPELQEHFQQKIQNMLVGPLEELQQLDQLRQEYLNSSSGQEKERLKQRIQNLEQRLEQDANQEGPFQFSDGFLLEDLPPLTDDMLAERMEAVGRLPDILIAIYKQRNNLENEAPLSLAIQMDYYEPQIQLLEQVQILKDINTDTTSGSETSSRMREDYLKAFRSLPKPVQEQFAESNGLAKDSTPEQVLDGALIKSAVLSPLLQIAQAANMDTQEPPEYNDIEFVDRSRYLEEFHPAIGNMEGKHPSEEDIQRFVTEVIDKKAFMVTSSPERVAGGYYIRGTNLLEDKDDKDSSQSAADQLIANVQRRLKESPLNDSLEFFYVLDPSPPTDEEFEVGSTTRPLFVVTTKDSKSFYRWADPTTKVGISLIGVGTTFLFSVGAGALNPNIGERFSNALDQLTTTSAYEDIGVVDWFFSDLCLPMFTALLGIQIAHEVGHRIIAFRDKFDIGSPTIVPSIITGFTGAITPLRSPPPNSKSMFDFAIAGPMLGIIASVLFLWNGLELTSTMELGTQFPVLPVDLIRSSSLGGGLVEYFLGSTAVLPGQGPTALLPLHPFAIAGFLGLITNALALLPLGHTDGGRIAVTMFGRRGAFVVKLFTALLLCACGIFGLDESNIFLIYTLFVLIWQRELESPARNEVDELDFGRGLLATGAALVVGLTLIPMI